MYDYVFDISFSSDQPPKKLPYNRGGNSILIYYGMNMGRCMSISQCLLLLSLLIIKYGGFYCNAHFIYLFILTLFLLLLLLLLINVFLQTILRWRRISFYFATASHRYSSFFFNFSVYILNIYLQIHLCLCKRIHLSS